MQKNSTNNATKNSTIVTLTNGSLDNLDALFAPKKQTIISTSIATASLKKVNANSTKNATSYASNDAKNTIQKNSTSNNTMNSSVDVKANSTANTTQFNYTENVQREL